jgi:GxxExxY protein
MIPADADVEQLTEKIIGCAIEVHRTLGPGLLESVYKQCMGIELRNAQLRFESERRLELIYKGTPISSDLRLDLLIEGVVIVELKAVDCLHPIYLSQVITYLKLTGCRAGLLLNFNVSSLRAGVRRLNHPDRYQRKSL